MSRVLKIALLSIVILLVIWGAFVIVDCIRLRNAKYYTYPLINLKQEANLEKVTYTGLGYTISYIQNNTITYDKGHSLHGIGACGAEFRLFDKFLLWAYIE